ncbi:MAG: carboxynorspermidine decarboxylase [Hyphomonadaceae bacterium]|nr:carboxynorspermidine decarboxylase [Hyphomonadaceae bacterium]
MSAHVSFPYSVDGLETPAYVVDLAAIDRNLAILKRVQADADCKILLALKAFALWAIAPRIRTALPGATASSTHEARLAHEEFGGETHACAPVYTDADFQELLTLCDHIVFNSATQKARLMPLYHAHRADGGRAVSFGMRVNHEHSEATNPLYDASAPCSRLGALRSQLTRADMEGLDGLHFHSLNEHGADAFQRALAAFEEKFADFIPAMKWINFGGGHHITRPDYDVDLLIRILNDFHLRHPGVALYLEPGQAIALNAGVLAARVIDIVKNEMDIAVLDTSAAAHMPDVIEGPYRPWIIGSDLPGAKAHTYRLGGNTCLSGDVIGDYSFDRPLRIGDVVLFTDMAHYTMVKNTTFNGVRLPSIALADPETRAIKVIRRFRYEDYKMRLS